MDPNYGELVHTTACAQILISEIFISLYASKSVCAQLCDN